VPLILCRNVTVGKTSLKKDIYTTDTAMEDIFNRTKDIHDVSKSPR
jgi:hypothetical protein